MRSSASKDKKIKKMAFIKIKRVEESLIGILFGR